MNYEPNTINWKVGDIVIHDADEKSERMLMRVITLFENERIGTEYLSRKGNQPIYHNPTEVLHDPARFGINTTTASPAPSRSQKPILSKCCNATISIGDCASECDECGMSVNPDTGESYGVNIAQVGGLNL